MISICITVKNRSRVPVDNRILSLFPNCVQSIVQSVRNIEPCELVVTDWHSDDWPLHQWLPQAAHPLPLFLLTVDGSFCRGKGRNLAARAAHGDALLFLDADSLLCPQVLQEGRAALDQGQAYFPVLYSFQDALHQHGYWRHFGYGNCMVGASLFQQTGGWPEYAAWGKEDNDFYAHLAARVPIVRKEVPEFYHQWHPEDLLWKDRFTARAPFQAQERQQTEAALADLEQLIPSGHTVILVDETRLGELQLGNRPLWPFLEKDGQYWGAPEDDTMGIDELERLRTKGASFLAFAWMSFWWLDYYPTFHQHLRHRYPCVLHNQRLVVFDLRPHNPAQP